MDPRSILVELQTQFFPIGYRRYHSLFSVCVFEDSNALALNLKVNGHKHLILQLIDHGKHSQMLQINLWVELQRLYRYRQYVSNFQSSKGDSVGYWNLSENHTEILKEFFQNTSKVDYSLISQRFLKLQVRYWQACSYCCGFLIDLWKQEWC